MYDPDSEMILTYLKAIKDSEYKLNEAINSNNIADVDKIIKKIKRMHGCAIYQYNTYLKKILDKPSNDITETEWIRLSSNDNFLYVIHNIVRKCEASVLRKNKVTSEINSDDILTKHSIDKAVNNNSSFTIKTETENGLNENNYIDEETETNFIDKTRLINSDEQLGGYNKSVLSDYIDNLNTSEAEYLENYKTENNIDESGLSEFIDQLSTEQAEQLEYEYEKQYGGNHEDSDKVTSDKGISDKGISVVYFWADWCPPSQKFNPVWKEFTLNVNKYLPGISYADLNANDRKLQQLPQKIGITSFPTIAVFNNKEVGTISASGKTVNDIISFIKSYYQSK